MRGISIANAALTAGRATDDPEGTPGRRSGPRLRERSWGSLPPAEEAEPLALPSPVERARRGIVILERRGRQVGLGMVLQGDWRILTAYSLLGDEEDLDLRLPDGGLVGARLGHRDLGLDLALLLPRSSRWQRGLKAARVPPLTLELGLSRYTRLSPGLSPIRVGVTRLANPTLGTNLPLEVYGLESAPPDSEAGGPLLDESGEVVAVLTRVAVTGNERQLCGLGVASVKGFLRTLVAQPRPRASRLGLRGVPEDFGPVRGVRVVGVGTDSPAALAGLRAHPDPRRTDVVVAVNDLSVLTPEALAREIAARAVESTVELLVYRNRLFRRVVLKLDATPPRGPAPPAADGVGSEVEESDPTEAEGTGPGFQETERRTGH